MKKSWIIILIILLIIIFTLGYFKLTGKIAQNTSEEHNIGPSAKEQQCMMTCMGCSSPGVGCAGNSEQCMAQCNVQKPESTEETSCMEECVLVGCTEFDFDCQNNNKETCEKDCNMLGDKPNESEMSAEQLCITNCVMSIDPNLRCGASAEGETGGETCQKCASDCVHLYAGPCLDDEKLKAKQKECETCENCYGEPMMGDSGEGWECITDVECKDASSEFGDEAGKGPGIGQEGYVAPNAIAGAVDGVIKFFKGIFGGEES